MRLSHTPHVVYSDNVPTYISNYDDLASEGLLGLYPYIVTFGGFFTKESYTTTAVSFTVSSIQKTIRGVNSTSKGNPITSNAIINYTNQPGVPGLLSLTAPEVAITDQPNFDRCQLFPDVSSGSAESIVISDMRQRVPIYFNNGTAHPCSNLFVKELIGRVDRLVPHDSTDVMKRIREISESLPGWRSLMEDYIGESLSFEDMFYSHDSHTIEKLFGIFGVDPSANHLREIEPVRS